MGRLLLLVLVAVAVWMLWRAFGPGSNERYGSLRQPDKPPAIKGPDDDEEFLWNIEKNRFKERRAREEAERKAAEEQALRRKFEQRYPPHDQPSQSADPAQDFGPEQHPENRRDGDENPA
ncbi:hypothetical protein [Corynebacterium aquatimens]|uniref:Uncharacterized protein n=1 Tax=Corynebacterium aquatimens TaxID=1190508 RepID=A0A931DY11_9CORY|nr:hypothetical protein [Corynebacterium aquatimens]MBG6122432.1 hypothetical protein [Corynebacterium aquatimens]